VVAKGAHRTAYRANVICPGFVRTPLVDSRFRSKRRSSASPKRPSSRRQCSGYGRWGVHHRARCRRGKRCSLRFPLECAHGSVPGREPRLVHAVIVLARHMMHASTLGRFFAPECGRRVHLLQRHMRRNGVRLRRRQISSHRSKLSDWNTQDSQRPLAPLRHHENSHPRHAASFELRDLRIALGRFPVA